MSNPNRSVHPDFYHTIAHNDSNYYTHRDTGAGIGWMTLSDLEEIDNDLFAITHEARANNLVYDWLSDHWHV